MFFKDEEEYKKYLEKNKINKEIGVKNQDIENARKDFIKQTIYNRFVKQADENNHNWGILVNQKTKKQGWHHCMIQTVVVIQGH